MTCFLQSVRKQISRDLQVRRVIINLKILNPQIFWDKSPPKIGSNFLVQLAGQISENNIQEFLVGSQYPKTENLVRNPEISLTFFVGRIKPGYPDIRNSDHNCPMICKQAPVFISSSLLLFFAVHYGLCSIFFSILLLFGDQKFRFNLQITVMAWQCKGRHLEVCLKQKLKYIDHLNTGPVWYLYGTNKSGYQVVRFLNGGLKTRPNQVTRSFENRTKKCLKSQLFLTLSYIDRVRLNYQTLKTL